MASHEEDNVVDDDVAGTHKPATLRPRQRAIHPQHVSHYKTIERVLYKKGSRRRCCQRAKNLVPHLLTTADAAGREGRLGLQTDGTARLGDKNPSGGSRIPQDKRPNQRGTAESKQSVMTRTGRATHPGDENPSEEAEPHRVSSHTD